MKRGLHNGEVMAPPGAGFILSWQEGQGRDSAARPGTSLGAKEWLSPGQHGVLAVTELPWPGGAGTAAQRRKARVTAPRRGSGKR